MSRTLKDKKWALRYPEEDAKFGRVRIKYESPRRDWLTGELLDEDPYIMYMYVDIAGAKTKKAKNYSGTWHWCRNTPSWWVREFMSVPKRAKCRNWEKTRTLDNLDELCPDYGRKPHIYYY
jgi:hypothetical protein